MAHGFTTTDDRSSFRYRQGSDPAWHKFGRPLAIELPTAREALTDAGLDFATELVPVAAEVPGAILEPATLAWGDAGIVNVPERRSESRRIELPDYRAHVRPDTGQVFGLVSPRFDQVENRDVAEFGDALRADDSTLRIEAVFSLYAGSTLCLTLSRGEVIDPNQGTGRPSDLVLPYLSLSNGHGGTRVFSAIPTTVRVVCANTLAMAESGSGARAIRFRHTRSAQSGEGMKEKLKQARTVLASAARLQTQFAEKVSALARRDLPLIETRAWFQAVYADCFGTEPSRNDVSEETLQKWHEKRRDVLAKWESNIDDKRQDNVRGSAWGALNAVTQWHEHERGRFTGEDDGSSVRQLESNTFGASATDKGKTFKRALALLAN